MPLGVDSDAVRRVWIDGRDPSLVRRRRVAALAAFNVAEFAFLSLYQLGSLKRLPDVGLPGFDAAAVNRSRKAYQLGTPDSPVAAALNGLILAVAAWGGTRATGRSRYADWLLALLVAGGALGSLEFMRNMAFVQRRVCLYCVLAASSALAMVPSALRELRPGDR